MSIASDIIISSAIKILTIHLQRVLPRNALTLTARWSALKAVLEADARSCITSATMIPCDVSQEQEQGLLRISPIPTPQEKDRSLSMHVPTERHRDCEIGRHLMSAEASLVVLIQLLWPISFETSGALQFSDHLLGFHT